MKLSRDDARQIIVQINKEHHVQKKQMDRLDFDTFGTFLMDIHPADYCRGKSLVIQFGRSKGSNSQLASPTQYSSSGISPMSKSYNGGMKSSMHSGGTKLPSLTTAHWGSTLAVPGTDNGHLVSPLSPGSPRQLSRGTAQLAGSTSPTNRNSTHLPSIHSHTSTSRTKRSKQREALSTTAPTVRQDNNRLSSLFGFKPEKKKRSKNGLKDWLGREQQQKSAPTPRRTRFSKSVKKSHFSDSKIITTSTQKKEERKKMESMLREAFNIFDTDNDQLISLNEFVHCMQQILRITMSPKQVNDVSFFLEKKELDWEDFILLLARVYSIEL